MAGQRIEPAPADKAVPDGSELDELVEEIRDHLEGERTQAALKLFNRMHPVDKGDVLVDLPSASQQEILEKATPEETADILEQLEPDEAVQVSERLDSSVLADVLDEASPDVAADVLRSISQERSEETLKQMEEAEDVIPLLQYPDESAGGLMSPEYPAVRRDVTVGAALDTLRVIWPQAEPISSVPVVDDQEAFVGILGLVRLALSRQTAIVGDVMNEDTVSASAETDQEECGRLFERYDLSILPVVEDGRLLGVIRNEDLVDVLKEEATEDMFRMAGVQGESVYGSLASSVRHRFPWLFVNLATVFLSALAIALFESTLAEAVFLAAFLPVVPGQGGMGGVQTLTLVVRRIAVGEVPRRRVAKLLAHELTLSLVHGLLLGVAVGLVAYAWKGNYLLAGVLAAAMVGNMLVGGFTGAGVPLLLRKLGMDPAVSSAVFVTTFTDVMGVLLFLGTATIFVGLL